MSKRDTDSDWKRVAETDPYWGVLSRDEFRKDALDADKLVQFMASGEQFAANLLALVRKHLIAQFSPKRVLDVGCGVGRLLLPLAKHADEAVGVDVAPSMLELCRRHALQAGINNLELFEGDDSLTKVAGEFDLVNTYIVLQHVPPDRGYRIIQAMLDRLKVGGVGSIQLTYAKSRRFIPHEQPKALYYRREGHQIIDLVETDSHPPVGTITMFDYDLNEVLARLSRVSGQPMMALPTNDDSHLGVHFVFAKARR
jgi:2-polyprenyl-3-methyl-5-hydroxy-6-metoxy-1,4-benzoquinol methylase